MPLLGRHPYARTESDGEQQVHHGFLVSTPKRRQSLGANRLCGVRRGAFVLCVYLSCSPIRGQNPIANNDGSEQRGGGIALCLYGANSPTYGQSDCV